ncbi:hypothetical protein HJ568_15500 [Vibrio breoganii]|uniref:Uncharacterized protein n=1 Tax=Vibrio breoganii TaxID=553239 RepID=A0ABX1UDB7_9VIBR|nr:hypothetical protein [Vibrio breoganii]NMR71359.1 hypothetical protein [Vibrio breoganii]TKG12529.1 hypothetical protein FCV84_15275 [Vibrio breoganii]TKG16085.1 hypothetical protein FCV81_16705 [Vibrio breoganii]
MCKAIGGVIYFYNTIGR